MPNFPLYHTMRTYNVVAGILVRPYKIIILYLHYIRTDTPSR